jgi:superfamily II DNA/RNA helicase
MTQKPIEEMSHQFDSQTFTQKSTQKMIDAQEMLCCLWMSGKLLSVDEYTNRNYSVKNKKKVSDMSWKRFFHTTVPLLKLKEARTADTFTFSTRYPRGLAMPLKVRIRNRNQQRTGKELSKLSSLTRKSMQRDGIKPVVQTHGKQKNKSSPIRSEKAMEIIAAKKADIKERNQKDSIHAEKFRLVTEEDQEWNAMEDGQKLRFESMGLDEEVVSAIRKGLGFVKSSYVQQALISTSLTEPAAHILCGSQTGTGKTVAYLAPTFHFLKTQERTAVEESSPKDIQIVQGRTLTGQIHWNEGLSTVRKLKRPRALILVPTRTLLLQICKVAKQLSYVCKQRVVGIHSKTKNVDELLDSPLDILVTTPSCVQELIKDYNLSLSECTRVVLDEADTLFDKNFLSDTTDVLDRIESISKNRKRPIPVTMVTATFPQTLNQATKRFGDLIRLTTPSLHKTPKKLHQDFLLLSQSTTKTNLLMETLKRAVAATNRILIFCNTQTSTDQVFSVLESKKYPVLKASSRMQREDVEENLKKFTTASDELLVLVATDIASRGVDTTLVGQVILYDFPHTVIDYMHRVGRTARFGRPGRATSFITKKDKKLADAIQDSLKYRRHMPSMIK